MKTMRLEHDWFPEPVPDNVLLGERNWLYSSFAFRHDCSRQPTGVQTGNDTGLYNGTFVNLGPRGQVAIGRFCTLVGVMINCNSRVVIGDYVFIAHEVVLADSFAATPFDGNAERPPQGPSTTNEPPPTSIVIGDNVWVGARAILLSGARIGQGAVVGAASVIDFEVPPYTLVAGNPARVVRRIDSKD
jgi:acetyltransferase-like isoleucine patch superfamily enzyme